MTKHISPYEKKINIKNLNEIWSLFKLNEREIANFMQKCSLYIITQDEC
jgi:hypothetical protein